MLTPPKTSLGLNRTTAIVCALFVVIQVLLSRSAVADELRVAAEASAAKAFVDQQTLLTQLQTEQKITNRVKLIKRLDRGLVVSTTNPLKQQRTAEAIRALEALLPTATGDDAIKVQRALYEMLARSSLTLDREKATQMLLAQPLLSPGQVLPSDVDPKKLDEASIADLKLRLQQGAASAGFALADFYEEKDPFYAKVYRDQAVYQATIDAQSGANAAVNLAEIYIDGRAGAKDAAKAMEAIALAVGNGSDAALSLMDSHFDDPLFADQKSKMKSLIEQALAGGSDQAAEMLILDEIDVKRYGFTLDQALWALGLLDEIKSSRSYYISSKLYAEGKLVPRDIRKADTFLAKLADVAAFTEDYQITIAKRIQNIDMPLKYQYKHGLPIFLRLAESGKGSAINRVSSLILGAMRDGYFASTSELPLPPEKIISLLQKNFDNGDQTSGFILGDIYRQGLIAPQNLDLAAQYYSSILQNNPGSILALKTEEAQAKILRRGSRTGEGRDRYRAELRTLSERGNLWAKKEYGSLLLDGIAEVPDSVEKGIALLFEDIDAGYYSASGRLLRFATEKKRKGVQTRLIATFEKLYADHPSPAVTFELATIYSALDRSEDAFRMLDRSDFIDDPEAMFLKSKIGLETGKIERNTALTEMTRAISLTPPTSSQLLKYARYVLSEKQKDGVTDNDALEIVARFADKGDFDAIEIGLKYMMQDIGSHQERLKRVIPWVTKEASDGRPDLLLVLADQQLGKSNDVENNRKLVKAIADNMDKMGERGSARNILARAYKNGFGVTIDLQKAADYRQQAAELGNQSALYEIGTTYLYGIDRERNLKEAESLIAAASVLDSNKARIANGRLHNAGFGTSFSEFESFAINLKAAESGSLAGMIEVGRAYLAGAGIEKNTSAGIVWLEKAANKKSPFAAAQLYFYYFIQDPSVHNQQARVWLDKAIEYGHSPSLIRKAVVLEIENPVANATEIQALLDQSIADGHNLSSRYRAKIAKDKLKQ
jgi:TPR repeat protein